MRIETLTLPELRKLRKDVQWAIDSYEARQKASALEMLEARAKELGFSLAELTSAASTKIKTRALASAKYRNPQNPEETWCGRGRPPRWLTVALTSGGAKREDFAILAR